MKTSNKKNQTSLTENNKVALLEYYKYQSPEIQSEIDQVRQTISINVKEKDSENILILAIYLYDKTIIQWYLPLDGDYKSKRKKHSEKEIQLYFYRKWFLIMKRIYSLEKLTILFWKKTGISVHSTTLSKLER